MALTANDVLSLNYQPTLTKLNDVFSQATTYANAGNYSDGQNYVNAPAIVSAEGNALTNMLNALYTLYSGSPALQKYMDYDTAYRDSLNTDLSTQYDQAYSDIRKRAASRGIDPEFILKKLQAERTNQAGVIDNNTLLALNNLIDLNKADMGGNVNTLDSKIYSALPLGVPGYQQQFLGTEEDGTQIFAWPSNYAPANLTTGNFITPASTQLDQRFTTANANIPTTLGDLFGNIVAQIQRSKAPKGVARGGAGTTFGELPTGSGLTQGSQDDFQGHFQKSNEKQFKGR